MKTESLLEALRAEIGFEWDEPFIIRMGIILKLVKDYGFRFNYILQILRRMKKDDIVTYENDPGGLEPESAIIAESYNGMSQEYYESNKDIWIKARYLDGFMFFQSHEDSRHSNPEGIPYRMRLFRAAYKNYGYPYHYTMDLLRHLEKDGFMQVLLDPDDSLSDDAVIAVLTKQIPHDYFIKHRDYWK